MINRLLANGKETRTYVLLLVVATLIAYAGSMDGQYVMDDHRCIAFNRSVDQLWPAADQIPHGLQRRHIGRLTFWLNYQLGGIEPFGYHVVNLLIHLAAGLVLFDLVRRTLELSGTDPSLRQRGAPIAAAVALLWLVHPLQTESVTYVIQRLEALVGLFYLLTLYCLFRGATLSDSLLPLTAEQRDNRWRMCAWYLLALTSFWLGIFTKESMATAVVVALLYDRAYLAGCWGEVFRRRGLLYTAMAPAMVWIAWVLASGPAADGKTSAGFELEGVTPWQYLLTQAGVLLHYLRLAVWPSPLCLDYQWPLVERWQEVVVPGMIVCSLLAVCIATWWFRPRVAMLGLAFFILLAPTSSIVPIADAAVEHRMYLPLAAVLLLIVLAATKWWALRIAPESPRRFYPPMVVGTVALVLMALTIERNRLYGDAVAMWQNVVEQAPHNARAYCNLGSSYARERDFAASLPHLRRAVELAPTNEMYQQRLQMTIDLWDYIQQELASSPNPTL